ncbi:phosphate ABC transporter permease subunit PstC [Allobranchiibius sp. GilTou73]|uniref:phosphate ABC transporter permease subunit PstC n=1 Tax=Allobranchiibius sp. GilTou73 TaxID=2904523 RepID=UPI001F33ABB0|nr:phosphate ABC transporter permease subunit PstC [Allobranchiibius sp. GilTou73]UIJ35947.1 phosphate ABC transporter permease subunit PstC [Allobranchiibius sp. GilTou73]
MSSITGVSVGDELSDPSGAPNSGAGASTGTKGDRVFGGLAMGAGLLVVAIVSLVAIFLLVQAVPAIGKDKVNFLTSREFTSSELRFGIVQLLWTTVTSSLVALVLAVPFAIGIALFLTHYAPPWFSRIGAALIDLLAAVPSIVYGLWGFYIVAPKFVHVQDALNSVLGWIPLFGKVDTVTGGATIMMVGVVLAIMILPIITALSREVFAQTPVTHKEGALALGATRWEMIRTAVLPFGRPGVISASMLGLGRALGETIAVLFILSALPGTPKWTWSLFNGGSTFASQIASDAPNDQNDANSMGALIAAGLVLFVLTFLVNAIARVIIERRKEFSE